MRTDSLSTGKFPHIISYTMRHALPFKYPKKWRNEERYSSETAVLLKNLQQSHTLLSKNKREYLRRKYKSSRSSPKTHLSQEKTKWTTSALREWSWLMHSIILHTWCSFSSSYSVQLKSDDLTIRENSTSCKQHLRAGPSVILTLQEITTFTDK